MAAVSKSKKSLLRFFFIEKSKYLQITQLTFLLINKIEAVPRQICVEKKRKKVRNKGRPEIYVRPSECFLILLMDSFISHFSQTFGYIFKTNNKQHAFWCYRHLYNNI
jgi:hypothetical protein